MRIQVLREAGLEEALLGLSLSYSQPPEKMLAVWSTFFCWPLTQITDPPEYSQPL